MAPANTLNTLNTTTAPIVPSSTVTVTTTMDDDGKSPASVSGGTATPSVQPHPFSEINKPFHMALTDAEQRDWCFHKGDISIDIFSSAITAFLTIFDAIGSPVITEIVRKDFRWKTNGLKNASKRLRADNVRDLVRKELKSPPRFWAASGIESLLWSHRILRFVESLVDCLEQDATLELRDAGQRAYRGTLAQRHPPMQKVVFEKALNLLPPRSKFVANLIAIHRDEDLNKSLQVATGSQQQQQQQQPNKQQVQQHKQKLQQVLQEAPQPTEHDYAVCLVGMKDFLRSTRPFIEALTTLFDMEEIEDDDYR